MFDSSRGGPQGTLGAFNPDRAQGSVCLQPRTGAPQNQPSRPVLCSHTLFFLRGAGLWRRHTRREALHSPTKSGLAALWWPWEARTLPQLESQSAIPSSLHLPLLAGREMAFPCPLETSLPSILLSDRDFSHLNLVPRPFVIPFTVKGRPRCCIWQLEPLFFLDG